MVKSIMEDEYGWITAVLIIFPTISLFIASFFNFNTFISFFIEAILIYVILLLFALWKNNELGDFLKSLPSMRSVITFSVECVIVFFSFLTLLFFLSNIPVTRLVALYNFSYLIKACFCTFILYYLSFLGFYKVNFIKPLYIKIFNKTVL